MALGNHAEGIAAFETAVAESDDGGQARLLLGQAYVAAGRREDGIRSLRQASERDPTSLDSQLGACKALLEAGEPELARAALERARRIAPHHPGLTELERKLAPADAAARP